MTTSQAAWLITAIAFLSLTITVCTAVVVVQLADIVTTLQLMDVACP